MQLRPSIINEETVVKVIVPQAYIAQRKEELNTSSKVSLGGAGVIESTK